MRSLEWVGTRTKGELKRGIDVTCFACGPTKVQPRSQYDTITLLISVLPLSERLFISCHTQPVAVKRKFIVIPRGQSGCVCCASDWSVMSCLEGRQNGAGSAVMQDR
jgi:hypothetical protein